MNRIMYPSGWKFRWGWVLLVGMLLGGWLAFPNTAQAQGDCFPTGVIETWEQLSTPDGSFIILYSEINAQLADAFLQTYGAALDADYARFARLFRQDLTLPVALRIYPIEFYYRCLNGVPPELAPDQVATRLGKREIALIADRIPPLAVWGAAGQNVIRHELARLFVASLTDEKAPPGLEAGLGYYLENPQETFLAHQVATSAPETPLQTWRELWETADLAQFPERTIPTMSIAAYLVDQYGWDSLLAYLKSLPTAGHYRQALVDIYKIEAGVLQEDWQAYYPLYLQDRWQAHVLYAFDLTHLDATQTTAYMCTAKELETSIEFLETAGDTNRLAEAQALYAKAMLGVEASDLARQARRALLAGDYDAAAEWIDQSQALYEQLNDTAALAVLAAYERITQETLALRAEAASLAPAFEDSPEPEQVERLAAIGRRLGELGDTSGKENVAHILGNLAYQRQVQARQWTTAGIVISLLFLGGRMLVARKTPPPEVLIG